MGFNFDGVLEECTPTRERHVIHQELKEILDIHCMTEVRLEMILGLINELENAAWEGGMSEGYDHGYQDSEHTHIGD